MVLLVPLCKAGWCKAGVTWTLACLGTRAFCFSGVHMARLPEHGYESAAADLWASLLNASWASGVSGQAGGWVGRRPACSMADHCAMPGNAMSCDSSLPRLPAAPQMGRMDVDLEAIEKWRAKDGEYAERSKELEVATAERDEVRRGRQACNACT